MEEKEFFIIKNGTMKPVSENFSLKTVITIGMSIMFGIIIGILWMKAQNGG